MTPLAHRWAKACMHPTQAEFQDTAGISDVVHLMRCFDITSVWDDVGKLAGKYLDGSYPIDTRLSFPPDEFVWIEFSMNDPQKRVALWFGSSTNNVDGRESCIFGSANHLGSSYCGEILFGGSAKIAQGDDFDRQSSAVIYAALAFINSPRHVNRHDHVPHRGLEKNIRQSLQNPIGFKLKPWTEIRLGAPDQHKFEGSDRRVGQAMPRAMHFCRSHLRLRSGRVEFVRHHWRGDPARGIGRSTYCFPAGKTPR